MQEQAPEFGLPQTLARDSIDAAEAGILAKHTYFHDIPIVEQPPKRPDPSLSVSGAAKTIRLWGHLKKDFQ